MAIALYRKGNTHIIKGVECEMTHCQASSLNSMLNAGWTNDVQSLKAKKRSRKSKADVELSEDNSAGQSDDDNT